MQAVKQTNRYPVLDALRFVLAFWVAVGHYGMFPLFAAVDESTKFGHFLVHGWNTIVFGTPAVLCFFVISGFCIHLPYRGDGRIPILRYYARRYTRILVPVAALLLFIHFVLRQPIVFTGSHSLLWQSILWSLLCEEIYYAIYPALRWLRNQYGWNSVLGGSFVVSVLISCTHFGAIDWNVIGPLDTAFLLLPVWILGCILAENAGSLVHINSAATIWRWRFTIWFASWAMEMLHFKSPLHIVQTMPWFGVLAYFWIKREIAYSAHKKPWPLLARAGAWSYSLYLFHASAMELYTWLHVPSMGAIADWVAIFAFMLASSYIFYLCVERPSHQLARKISVTQNLPLNALVREVH